MPAIASLEDLKAAQKDLRPMFLAVFPLPLAPYDLRGMRDGAASVGKMFVSYGWGKELRSN